jgi:hypothetical protein
MGTGFGGGGGGGAAAEAANEARERSTAARKRGEVESDAGDEGRAATAIDAAAFIESPTLGRTDALPAADADVSVRSRNVDADDELDADDEEDEATPRRRAASDIMATNAQWRTKGTMRFANPPLRARVLTQTDSSLCGCRLRAVVPCRSQRGAPGEGRKGAETRSRGNGRRRDGGAKVQRASEIASAARKR